MSKKMPTLLFGFGLTLFLGLGCSSDSSNGNGSPTLPSSFFQQWLSNCVTFNDGEGNPEAQGEIFFEPTTDGKMYIALVTYSEADCQGGVTLMDFEGNEIEDPEHVNNFETIAIENIPDNFFVLKVVEVGEQDDEGFFLIRINGNNLHMLTEFNTAFDTWDEWLANTDVAGFVDSPSGYEPESDDLLRLSFVPDDFLSFL